MPIHQASSPALNSRAHHGVQNGMASGGGSLYSSSYNGKQNGFLHSSFPSSGNGMVNGYHNGVAMSRQSSFQGGISNDAFANSVESFRAGTPPPTEYNEAVDELRETEYPNMRDGKAEPIPSLIHSPSSPKDPKREKKA